MSDGNRALHGICWLKLDGDRVVPTADAAQASITSPSQLDAGQYELYWLGTPERADAFAQGINAVGRNTISAARGSEGAAPAVLVLRADEPPSAAATLDDAVPFHALAPTSSRRAAVRWAHVIASISTMYRSESQSIKPVRVGEIEESGFSVRVSYPFWGGHIHGGIEGGDNMLQVVDVDGADYLRMRLERWPQTYRAIDTFLAPMLDAARPGGWFLEDGSLMAPVDPEGFAPMMLRLSPVFKAMWDVEVAAAIANSRQDTRDSPASRKIMNALAKGATLVDGPKRAILTHRDGRTEVVSADRVAEMERANMIRAMPELGKGFYGIAEEGFRHERKPDLDTTGFVI